MSHNKATTDTAIRIDLYSRIGMYNEKRLIFRNTDGTDYDLSAVTFEIGVKKLSSSTDDFVTLTEGSGITKSSNYIDFVFNEAQSATFKETDYYWEVRRTIGGFQKVWITGDHKWTKGKFNGVTPVETITITEDCDDIIVTISESGGQSSVAGINSIVSTSTLTPNAGYDIYKITALAEALTIVNPTTDHSNGAIFELIITDNGTGRALTWDTKFRAFGSALPTTTTANKTLYVGIEYNEDDDTYDVLGTKEEF